MENKSMVACGWAAVGRHKETSFRDDGYVHYIDSCNGFMGVYGCIKTSDYTL